MHRVVSLYNPLPRAAILVVKTVALVCSFSSIIPLFILTVLWFRRGAVSVNSPVARLSDGSVLECLDLSARVTKDDRYPFAGGGYSDVYRGRLSRFLRRPMLVAIKEMRIPGTPDSLETKRKVDEIFKREVDIFAQLKHKNVVPLLGICQTRKIGRFPAIIMPLCVRILDYVKGPRVDPFRLVTDIAAGLQYLHSRDIVHSDLKCDNVLVNEKGDACIGDFGISKILNRRGYTQQPFGTPGYMAPELLGAPVANGTVRTTKASDIFSFGLLALQILTGEVPAYPQRLNWQTQCARLSDPLRELVESCCAHEPQRRPTINVIVDLLANIGDEMQVVRICLGN